MLHVEVNDGCTYSDDDPMFVCRSPLSKFVGLKNGGATCYMNAVFQQLFMQPSIRKMLLSVPACSGDQTENVFFQMQVIRCALPACNCMLLSRIELSGY